MIFFYRFFETLFTMMEEELQDFSSEDYDFSLNF